MKRGYRQIVLALAGCLSGPLPVLADEAEQALKMLYGKDLQRVGATADRADDVALARQMLEAARSAAGQPKFVALLCRKAYDLAAAHPGGYETAVDAMDFLAGALPEERLDCLKKSLEVHQRRYSGARGDARLAAANTLMDCLTALADEAAASEDYGAAAGHLRRASYLAATVRSNRKDALQARLKQLTAQDRTAKLIVSLKDRLKSDPRDTASRERLVRLHLIERDDPNSAAGFLDAGCDQALQTYVPMAAKDADSLADAACLELGDWYLSLAERASADARAAMLYRAERYYGAFLSKHTAADLAVTRVRIALKKIEDQLAKLSPSQATVPIRPGPSAEPKTGGALSAVALVSRPGTIEGVQAWTIETRQPRGKLHAVAYAPDGKRLAVGGEWGTVRILDAAGGGLARILVGHDAPVCDLAFSPDGTKLASASVDKTIRLWRIETGKCLLTMRGHSGAVYGVAFSPDGRTLASVGSDGNLGLWRAQSGRLGALLRTGRAANKVAWVLNGKAVATPGTGLRHGSELSLWAAGSGRPLPLPVPPAKRGARGLGGGAAALSPDSRLLAAADRLGSIELREFKTAKVIRTLKASGAPVVELVWSPGGKFLAAYEDDRRKGGNIRLWDARTWESAMELKAGEGTTFIDFAWSGDGRNVTAIAGDDTVRVWEAASGRVLQTVSPSRAGSVRGVALSPDARTLACGTSGSVWFWDVPAGGVRAAAGGYENRTGVHAMAWAPDGKTLATGAHDGVRIVDANSGDLVSTISAGTRVDVSAVDWSADGSMLAYAAGSTACLATAQTWRHVLSMKQDQTDRLRRYASIRALDLSPDGKLLACAVRTSKGPGGADIWQIPAGQRLGSLAHENAEVLAVAWAPDGKTLATGAGDGKIRFWDARAGHCRKGIASPAAQQIHALAWSPNGRMLAAAGCAAGGGRQGLASWDRPVSIQLWGLASGRMAAALRGHVGGVHSLAWSSDGQTLASACSRMVKLWDLQTRLPRMTLLPVGGAILAISRQGHFRVSGGMDPQKDLVYVAETVRGQEVFSPGDFAKRYGWKNDPARLAPTTRPAGE